MTTRAILYVRVSTDEQAEKGYSLPSQLDACRKYAAQHDMVVAGVQLAWQAIAFSACSSVLTPDIKKKELPVWWQVSSPRAWLTRHRGWPLNAHTGRCALGQNVCESQAMLRVAVLVLVEAA